MKKKAFFIAAAAVLLMFFLGVIFLSPGSPASHHRPKNPFGTYPNVGF